ncbi:MAG: hypothetical protein PHE77_00485 [Candidatus Pacebacteria bacterium]|nr:hypothetical protein [Candidatus Paceibacterota bacterium]
MNKFGFWWESKEKDFFIARNGITKEEAEEILPQIIDNLKVIEKRRKNIMMLVQSKGVQFYLSIWRNRLAELPITADQKVIRTDHWDELPKEYQDIEP